MTKEKTIWILNKDPHQFLALSYGWVVEQSGTYLAQNLGRNIENIFCTFLLKFVTSSQFLSKLKLAELSLRYLECTLWWSWWYNHHTWFTRVNTSMIIIACIYHQHHRHHQGGNRPFHSCPKFRHMCLLVAETRAGRHLVVVVLVLGCCCCCACIRML